MYFNVYETNALLEGGWTNPIFSRSQTMWAPINKNLGFYVTPDKTMRNVPFYYFYNIDKIEIISIYEIKYLKGDEYVECNY